MSGPNWSAAFSATLTTKSGRIAIEYIDGKRAKELAAEGKAPWEYLAESLKAFVMAAGEEPELFTVNDHRGTP